MGPALSLSPERTPASRQTTRFLRSLQSSSQTPGVPSSVRRHALSLLHGYPGARLALATVDKLAQSLHRKQPAAVLVAQIRDFRQIRCCHGQRTAHRLLGLVASALGTAAPKGWSVQHLGGAEFRLHTTGARSNAGSSLSARSNWCRHGAG